MPANDYHTLIENIVADLLRMEAADREHHLELMAEQSPTLFAKVKLELRLLRAAAGL